MLTSPRFRTPDIATEIGAHVTVVYELLREARKE